MSDTKKQKLEDFGDYIAGAKKETYFRAIDPTSEEAKSLPLSKLWNDKDIKAIDDIQISAIAHTLKDSLPSKPRQSYKLNRWLTELHSRQMTVVDLVEKNDPVYTQAVLGAVMDMKNGEKAYILPHLDRNDWKRIGKVSMYQVLNAGNAIRFSVEIDKKTHYFDPKTPVTLKDLDRKKLIDEFIGDIKTALANREKGNNNQTLNARSFDIYTRRSDNTAFICYKNDRQKTPLIEFNTLKEAREYRSDPENIATLNELWTAHREHNAINKADMRNETNEERTGQSYRDHDITTDEFEKTFGIKGGQFGNWVNNDERQQMLNATYDGLMDLAKTLNISPKAIGLNGTLNIAFGARGSGLYSAHYETGEKVINLTKTRGAGSLAHEWWHAFDHYMKNGDTLLTQYLKTNSTARHSELVAPVGELVKTIHSLDLHNRSIKADGYRNNAYFSTDVEMTARAFEGYIKNELSKNGIKNDFLVNIRAENDWQKNPEAYPYPKEDELEQIGKAYTAIFDTLKEVDKEFAPVHYEPEPIIHADTLAVTGTEKTKEAQETIQQNQEAKTLNIIVKDFSNDPASKEVQDRVIALAQNDPQALIKTYTQLSTTFDGRYIASDMMKEVFDDFNQSPAHRNQFNNAVHNTAATLSALHFEQMLNEPNTNGRDTVVFLTGCPGAGKTSSVMNNNGLEETIKAVFEGQLANAHISNAPIEKIQQALDNNLKVKIIAVNPLPEQALENTFTRYKDPNDGRGAPISTMARIQGNTYDGLKAIYDKFGDRVELNILDKPTGNKTTIKYMGWQHLDVLKSQGTEADIMKRLETHLIKFYTEGKIDYECFKQSAGSDERAKQLISTMARPLNPSERENGDRREISSGSNQKSNTKQGRSSSPVSQEFSEAVSTPTPNISQYDTKLNTPYAEKNQAKALGAKWDNTNKTWYAPAGLDLNKFEKWLPQDRQTDKSGQILGKSPQPQRPQGQSYGIQPADRIYLYTQPSDNPAIQELKAQGIVKFDLTSKVWYAHKDNADKVSQWTTRPNVPTPEQALTEHLRSLGIKVDAGHPIFDDRPHRLSNDGSTDKNVMYHAYLNNHNNGVPFARITNFSRNGTTNWTYPVEYLNNLKSIEAVDRAMGNVRPQQQPQQKPQHTQSPKQGNRHAKPYKRTKPKSPLKTKKHSWQKC